LAYCDEITLYPDSIIDMIQTRLSQPHSKLFASCNPSYPTHKIKQWIDFAQDKDSEYYELQFMLDHNPYLEESYKQMIKNSLSSLFLAAPAAGAKGAKKKLSWSMVCSRRSYFLFL
jgi:hypothetical protein